MVAVARRSESRPGTGAFSRLLRERRLASAITQEALAQHFGGVTGRTVGDWERGISAPGTRHYRALAEFMELPGPAGLLELLEADDDYEPPPEAAPVAPVLTMLPSTNGPRTAVHVATDTFAMVQTYWDERLAADRAGTREMSEQDWARLNDFMSHLVKVANSAPAN